MCSLDEVGKDSLSGETALEPILEGRDRVHHAKGQKRVAGRING